MGFFRWMPCPTCCGRVTRPFIGWEMGYENLIADRTCLGTNVGHAALMSVDEVFDAGKDSCCVIFYSGSWCIPGLWTTDPAMWWKIHDYVVAGGAVVIVGEYAGCMSDWDRAELNEFLSTLGSSMTFSPEVCCHPDHGCWNTQSVSGVKMMEGISKIPFAAASYIIGGTPLVQVDGAQDCVATPGQVAIMAAEKVGKGYVITIGDSSAFRVLEPPNEWDINWVPALPPEYIVNVENCEDGLPRLVKNLVAWSVAGSKDDLL